MSSIFRSMIDALVPPDGPIWVPKVDGDLDTLLDGIADAGDLVIADLAKLADIRNPYKTTMLEDMEVEYGIRPTDKKTDTERRGILAAAITGGAVDGSIDTLQEKLDQAGFNVTVYANDPPVDPDTVVSGLVPPTVCGNADAVCGGVDIVCGGVDEAYLIVNGDSFGDSTYFTLPPGDWYSLTTCGDPSSPICGGVDLTCGSYYSESSYWSMVFFIGGEATYTPEGEIASIEAVEVPLVLKDDLKRIVLKYKPMHSWCAMIIAFT